MAPAAITDWERVSYLACASSSRHALSRPEKRKRLVDLDVSLLDRQSSRARREIRPGLLSHATLCEGAETLQGILKTRHVADGFQERNPGDQILH